MSIVTPMLDSLRPLVLGRAIDLSMASQQFVNSPLSAVAAIRGAAGQRANRRAAEAGELASNTRTHRARETSVAERAHVRESAAAKAGATARGVRPGESQNLSISRAGQFLTQALGATATLSPSIIATAGRPLMAGGQSANVFVLAGLLETQVTTSGVFYEAHLLQWLRGRRSFDRLIHEPQARMPRNAGPVAGRQPARALPTSLLFDAHADDNTGNSKGWAGETQASYAQLGHLARQQIEALHSGLIRWQGFAAPDVPMDWEIREHVDDYPSPQDQIEAVDYWHSTSLRLDLPKLGQLEIRLMLRGDRIDVQAWSEKAESYARLNEAQKDLRARLGERGFAAIDIDLVSGTPT